MAADNNVAHVAQHPLFDFSNICELFDSCENTDPNLCKDCVSGQPYCGVSESDIESVVTMLPYQMDQALPLENEFPS